MICYAIENVGRDREIRTLDAVLLKQVPSLALTFQVSVEARPRSAPTAQLRVMPSVPPLQGVPKEIFCAPCTKSPTLNAYLCKAPARRLGGSAARRLGGSAARCGMVRAHNALGAGEHNPLHVAFMLRPPLCRTRLAA